MKTSKQIKSFILKKGNKLTNAEMSQKLEVPRMTFAGVLAAMKRNGELKNDFLKTDTKKTVTKPVSNKKVTNALVNVSKIKPVKAGSSKTELIKKLVELNKELINVNNSVIKNNQA